MAAFYRDGERYPLDGERSVIRFELHNLGIPTLRGTLHPRAGEIVVGAEAAVRSADFHVDAASVRIDGHNPHAGIVDRLFGSDDHPTITFTTTWARPVGHGRVELEGILTMHGAEHLFSLRSEGGAWEPGSGAMWHRGTARGVLDRTTWENRRHTLRDVADLLLGHDVHLVAELYAGPRPNQ